MIFCGADAGKAVIPHGVIAFFCRQYGKKMKKYRKNFL